MRKQALAFYSVVLVGGFYTVFCELMCANCDCKMQWRVVRLARMDLEARFATNPLCNGFLGGMWCL